MTANKPPKQPRAGKARGKSPRDAAPLAERYAYEMFRRSGWERAADTALGGDRECIKDLAGIGMSWMYALSRGGTATADADTAPAAEALAYVLGMIHGGSAPDVAFGYKQAANRPADFEALRKQVMIGRHFNLLRNNGEKREVAKIEVAARWNVSPSYAAECGDALAEPKKPAKRRKK